MDKSDFTQSTQKEGNGMLIIKGFKIPDDEAGKKRKEYWIQCPYCGKRQFPIGQNTKIRNLLYRCKGSSCKRHFLIDTKLKKEM